MRLRAALQSGMLPADEMVVTTRRCNGEDGVSMSDERFEQRLADRLQPLLDAAYLARASELDVAELRRMRDECEAEERRVSYARRILQGRIDVLRSEASRRTTGGALGVLERLSDVLADQGQRPFDPATARPPAAVDPGDLGDVDLDGVADVTVLDDAELAELADQYAQQESTLSSLRRRLFDVIDRLQSEIADRYRSGSASVSELLTGD